MNLLDSTWFYWAVGIAIGLPAGLIVLTELHNILVRRNSHLARQASLLRNYLLPLGAVLLLLVKASESRPRTPPCGCSRQRSDFWCWCCCCRY